MLGSATNPRTQRARGNAKSYIEQTSFTYRAAYAHGATGANHRTAGVLIGTSNSMAEIQQGDGLQRRLAQIPLTRHPAMDDEFSTWDDIVADTLPRAMSRAAKQWAAGIYPRITQDDIDYLAALKGADTFDTSDFEF